MMEKLMDCFSNPVKCRLLIDIQTKGHTTAKQLAETHKDIPMATLYRYLKRMTEDNILKVVEETHIRGTIEKTYAIAVDLNNGIEEMLEKNPGATYMQLFMNYISGFIQQFQTYCNKANIDLKADRSGFSLMPVYASDEELEQAVLTYAKAFEPLRSTAPSPDRKLRTIGLIITPPHDYDEQNEKKE